MLRIMLMTSLAVTVPASRDASTQVSRERFETIPVRNAFGLKPMPAPVETAPPPRPRLEVLFTGITVRNGVKRAYFQVTDPQIPRGHPNATRYVCIAEGQRQGELEVLLVDERAGAVKIRHGGMESLLTFEKNGNKPNPVSTQGRPPIPILRKR